MHTKALEGIDRMSCRCFAPLLLHFNREAGMGILISVPDNRGLFEITLIPYFSAVSKNDCSSLYLSAKV